MRGRWVLALGLALVALALYWPVGRFEFLNYDDPDYVTGNAVVARGLTVEGLRWAFTYQAANWHPLTWLSHMLDVELFGLDPGAHHLVNAGLHALNTALLFLALTALTRRRGASLVVAALFAVHPLRVQSVAWIAERKDLLSSAFFLALLWAHAGYARRPGLGRQALVVLLMALGCMAKPMLVTAPFVLLLLDVWPLGRWRGLGGAAPTPDTPSRAPTRPGKTNGARGGFALLAEKIPLLLIAIVSSALTLQAQHAGGAVGALEHLGVVDRLWTAAAGYASYLRATVWPTGLAAFHPHPLLTGGSLLVPGLVGLVLVAIGSGLAWHARRCCPALAVGWAWFLGMLVPVIGLVQVGDQAWAERYAYLPTIGLAIAVVYPLAQWSIARPGLRRGLAALAAVGVLALAGVTHRTLPTWRDSRSLFEHDLAVTPDSWIAHNNLGLVFLERRDLDRAGEHFEAATRARPAFVQAHYNLGLVREAQLRYRDAVASYEAALAVVPDQVETLLRLAALARADRDLEKAHATLDRAAAAHPRDPAVWLAQARGWLADGELERAGNSARSALSLDDSLVDAVEVLAEVAFRQGEIDAALEQVRRVLASDPNRASALSLLARIHMRRGERDEARETFERSLSVDPQQPAARHDLGALLLSEASQRRADRDAARDLRASARSQFQAVLDLNPGDPEALAALAVMELEEGHVEEAVAGLREALERRPEYPTAWSNLALAYERLARWPEAVDAYEHALAGGPPPPETARALAWLLATCPDESVCDGERALPLAITAAGAHCVQSPSPRLAALCTQALEVLAAAQARAGHADAAVNVQTEFLQRVAPEGRAEAEARLELYRSGRPYTRPR